MPLDRSGFGAVVLGDGHIAVICGGDCGNTVPGAHVIALAYLFIHEQDAACCCPRYGLRGRRQGPSARRRIDAIEGSTQLQANDPTRIVEALDIKPT